MVHTVQFRVLQIHRCAYLAKESMDRGYIYTQVPEGGQGLDAQVNTGS
jgi:hypothetical protein